MTEKRDVSAREFVYEPEGYPACAFCGSEVADSISSLLNEAHQKMEALGLADPDSEEFTELLDDLRSFVGGDPSV